MKCANFDGGCKKRVEWGVSTDKADYLLCDNCYITIKNILKLKILAAINIQRLGKDLVFIQENL
jgi:hypothetical protein